MNKLNYKIIDISELEEKGVNLFILYYYKFNEIYGSNYKDILESDSSINHNFQLALTTHQELKEKKYPFVGMFINDKFIGGARIVEKENEVLIPEIVFIKGITLEEQNSLALQFIKYIENYYQNDLYVETPIKNQTLLYSVLSQGFEMEYDNGGSKYFSNLTYLLSKKKK